MNMIDMVREAQEICEKARASVATEDCMDAAYKLCDLQVLLVRMEYEAKAPVTAPPVYEGCRITCSCSASEQEAPRFDNMPNPTPTVTQDPAQTHIDVPAEWGTVEGEEDMEPTITDLRDEDIPHTSEVTSGSRFTLGGILGRH